MITQEPWATGGWPSWIRPSQSVIWPDLFNLFNNSLYGTFRTAKTYYCTGAFFIHPAFFRDGDQDHPDRYFSPAQLAYYLCDRTIWGHVGPANGRIFCNAHAGSVSLHQRC